MAQLPYYDLAQKYGQEEGVDPKLIESVMEAESGGRPTARSGVGAEGLMQIMPSTGAGLAASFHESNPNLYDPRENVKLGSLYLSELLREFHGNRDEAVAGYNAGGGAVEHYHGIPPYKETQQYVKTVEGYLHDLGDAGGSYKAPSTPQIDWEKVAEPLKQLHNLGATLAGGKFLTHTFMSSWSTMLEDAEPWENMLDLINRAAQPLSEQYGHF